MPKKTRKSCPVGKKVSTRNNHRRKSCVNDYSVAFLCQEEQNIQLNIWKVPYKMQVESCLV